MAAETGERPEHVELAKVLYHSMDQSCKSDISTLMATIGEGDRAHVVNPKNWLDLSEYVRGRQQRDRVHVPSQSRKMDVSAFAEAQNADLMGHDQGLVPSPWHEPSTGTPWTPVGGDGYECTPCGDIDAMRFGKGGTERVLDCHNCGGLGHPSRLCPSPWGSKGKPGMKCKICGGIGHMADKCPSQGGGAYKPPTKGEKGGQSKGKGKNTKGGGKGEPSRYFKGKGSGVSSFEEEYYSAAEWMAWMQQRGTTVGAASSVSQQQNMMANQSTTQAGQPMRMQQGSQNATPWMVGAGRIIDAIAPSMHQHGQIRALSSVTPSRGPVEVPLAEIISATAMQNKKKRDRRRAQKERRLHEQLNAHESEAPLQVDCIEKTVPEPERATPKEWIEVRV